MVVDVVDGEDDVRSGPGGDGREVESDGELTLLVDKVGDCRVGDWRGPTGKKGRASAMRKKKNGSGKNGDQ